MLRRTQESIRVCVSLAMFIGLLAGQAGSNEAKEPVVSQAGSKARPSAKPIQRRTLSGDRAGRQSAAAGADVRQRPKRSAGASPARRGKTPRAASVSRAPNATTMIQPSQRELALRGLLESPQRYDPRLHRRAAGLPVPQRTDIVRDHFLELDRNQDGHVDPVERVFGRLDMEHDLQPR